ncbi:MAG: hypothetical protein K2Q22_15715 [Cytophagales bacterium]|nr:hypothetical protein [Cytophagales bacterium]
MSTYLKIQDCVLDTGMQQPKPTPNSSGGNIPSPCPSPFGTSFLIVTQNNDPTDFPTNASDPSYYNITSRLEDKLTSDFSPAPDFVNFVKVKISNIGTGLANFVPANQVNIRIYCPGHTQFTHSDFSAPENLTGSPYCIVKPAYYAPNGESDLASLNPGEDTVLVYSISDAQLLAMRNYGHHYCIIAEIVSMDVDSSGTVTNSNSDPDGAPSANNVINNVAWEYRRLAQRNIDRILF